MEVFVGAIGGLLGSDRIESFIYAVVKAERHFTSALSPNPASSTTTAVASVPINKAFYFKRIERNDGYNFGIITFARERVGAWFVEYAPKQPFVRKHGLRISKGKRKPSKAFVKAIEENATDRHPSASVKKHGHFFISDDLCHIGYWSAPYRFSYTHSFRGWLTIEENTFVLASEQGSLSFLARDVRTYSRTFLKVPQPAKDQCGSIFLFELKQNPQLEGTWASSDEEHSFQLPTKVIRIAFGSDQRSAANAKRFWTHLESLLAGIPELNMRQIQMGPDNYTPFITKFLEQSKNLNLELAFHRESLLRNELMNVSALSKVSPRLDRMINQGQQELALRVLRNLVPKLELRQERGKDEEQVLRITNRLWDEACSEAVANDSNGLLTFLEPSQSKGDDHLASNFHVDITPTRVLLSGPDLHVSNRVIRAYRDHWHHFLRLTFTNEDRGNVTTIKPNHGFGEIVKYIQSRVTSILKHGLNVAGRRWSLLGWSASSMSTHTVWFVTPFRDVEGRWIDANAIRDSLGDFSDVIRSPALYGARLSQAFSATTRTVEISNDYLSFIPDITTEGEQVHTDGVGQISSELMVEVWKRYVSSLGERRKHKLLKASAPSAIQIRLGGNKGMLAVNSRLTGLAVKLRPSMSKFGSRHQVLEVANSSSRCLPAKLNRPLINALCDRDVPPTAFLAIQEEAISQVGKARSNFAETAKLCSVYNLGTGCNLRVLFEKLHRAGLGAAAIPRDSFFLVLAKAVTAAALGDMKRKARIPVRGVTLLGIADEFAFLKEGEVFAQVETVELGRVSRRILRGPKLIGRSPTIDPGDVAMVNCIVPPPGHPLLQLRNIVAFNTCSQKQPLPRRLGGGDLDGDLYTLYEDERLFPMTLQPEAVFHERVQPKSLLRDCHSHDLADFFADFMLNDFIGLVSHLHLRIADASEAGSEDERCKELAKLHSQATDFRKTGVAVTRDQLPYLEDPIVPDFIAQGESREGRLVYSSTRVLGYLFRAVSWNETDTPSLDKNTDPETGLERVQEADDLDDDGVSSEFGSEFSSLLDELSGRGPVVDSVRVTVGSGPRSSIPANSAARCAPQPSIGSRIKVVDASPWQFVDNTFPQWLQRISWANRSFLPAIQSGGLPENEADTVNEGQRYVPTFLGFTRALRQLSRLIASRHPNPELPQTSRSGVQAPADGVFLVSEVHLLTGRLPWAKVRTKMRTEQDNDLLERMQCLCTLLRKNFCRISEALAFGDQPSKNQYTEEDNPAQVLTGDEDVAAVTATTFTVASTECPTPPSSSEMPAKRDGANLVHSRAPNKVTGDESAGAPFELEASEDEESSSGGTDDVVLLDSSPTAAVPLSTPKPRSSLASVTQTQTSGSLDMSDIRREESVQTCINLKRKASQDADLDRREPSYTPTPEGPPLNKAGRKASPNLSEAVVPQQTLEARPPSPAAELLESHCDVYADPLGFTRLDHGIDDAATEPEEQGEEGELTIGTAQTVVDSLWQACHFFSSPKRPRYSNVYGYNTFMITLVLHTLSMLESLKHLHRQSRNARYFDCNLPNPLDKRNETHLQHQNTLNDNVDQNYSLTQHVMSSLDLDNLLPDLASIEHEF